MQCMMTGVKAPKHPMLTITATHVAVALQVYASETKDEFSKPMIFFGNFWTGEARSFGQLH